MSLIRLQTDFTASSGRGCLLTITVNGTQVAIDAEWKTMSTAQDRRDLAAFVEQQLKAPVAEECVIEDDETRARYMSKFLRQG